MDRKPLRCRIRPVLSALILALALALLSTLPASASDNDFNDLDVSNLELASVHAAIMDLETGELLHGKFPDESVPIASLTKVMTALVILESGQPLDEYVTIVDRDRPAPVNAYSRIRIDSEATREDLVRIALMASENLAAHVLARQYPGGFDAFVEAMNEKARELGMASTHFVDPSGLSSDNRSSAADLTRLLSAAWEHELLRELSTTRYHTVNFRSPRYQLRFGNTNVLVHRQRWDVGLTKTGYLNEAGRCLMMAAEIEGKPVGIILLDSFGKRTPLGDAGRVQRWLTTGHSGRVAGPAQRYEQERAQELEALQGTRTANTEDTNQ